MSDEEIVEKKYNVVYQNDEVMIAFRAKEEEE